jgi:hypothetical protein
VSDASSSPSERRAATIIASRVRKPQFQLKLLQRSKVGDWTWTVRKSWDAEQIDEVLLLRLLADAWKEAERSARIRRAKAAEKAERKDEPWERVHDGQEEG